MRKMVWVAALLACLHAPACRAATEADYIRVAKRASVRELDADLPRMMLERWLKRLAGRSSKIAWEANDCGETDSSSPADSGYDLPVCVEAEAPLEGGSFVDISVIVGTMNKGIIGNPELFWAYIVRGDSTEQFRSLAKLARRVQRR